MIAAASGTVVSEDALIDSSDFFEAGAEFDDLSKAILREKKDFD